MLLDFHPIRALFTLMGYEQGRSPNVAMHGQQLNTDLDMDRGAATYGWFKKETELAADRVSRYREFDAMDADDIIASALDLYAEDACQADSATGKIIWVESSNKEIAELANGLLASTSMNENCFKIVRQLGKYGDHFEAVLVGMTEEMIPVRVAGLRTMPVSSMSREEDENGRLMGFRKGVSAEGAAAGDLGLSYPWEYIHWRLTGNVDAKEGDKYGTSIIAPARRTYRYLKMMEEAMAIYRIRRAPDRLKWRIDVGDATPEEATAIINTVRQNIRKRFLTDPNTGETHSEMNPLSLDEDIFIPVTDDFKTDVDVLRGTITSDKVLDIDYFRKKLFGCLRIPPDYMGYADSSGTLSTNTPLSNQDIRFARTVKRLQQAFMTGVVLLIKIDMVMRRMNVNDKKNHFVVHMRPVTYLEELQQAEVATVRARVVTDLLSAGNTLGIDKSAWIVYVAKQSGFPEEVLKPLLQKYVGPKGEPLVGSTASKFSREQLLTEARTAYLEYKGPFSITEVVNAVRSVDVPFPNRSLEEKRDFDNKEMVSLIRERTKNCKEELEMIEEAKVLEEQRRLQDVQ